MTDGAATPQSAALERARMFSGRGMRSGVEDRPRITAGEATLEDWQTAFVASSEATFFHGPAWSQTWEDYTQGRFRPSPRRIVLADGRVAILGVTVQSARFGRVVHHLSPGGVYGGWVSGHALRSADIRALEAEVRCLGSFVWRRAPGSDGHSRPRGGDPQTTHVIDLSRGAEAPRAAWKDAAKRRARHAARGGVVVREAEGDEDWQAYDGLYRLSLERWGRGRSSTYEPEFFSALRSRGGDSVRLWLAEAEGRLAAGALVLTAGRHAVYWHGAFDPAAAPGASNLLHWEIIGALADAGTMVYDLNPSGGHPGVVRFKETLGAVAQPAPLLTSWSPAETLARSTVRRLRSRRRGAARAR